MNRSIATLVCIVLGSLAVSACGQVVPSATARRLTVDAGGFASAFQPDYAGNGIAQTSPNRLYGIGAYVDVKFTRWIQVEAEGRWLNFNDQFSTGGITVNNGENNYLIGPRVPFSVPRVPRLKVYGKGMIGFSSASFLVGRTMTFAYGGGLDYRLSRRFTLRPIDFEYQEMRVTPTLYPYGISVGLSYKVF
jgi:hypothetical protein